MGDNYVFDKSMIAALGNFSNAIKSMNKTFFNMHTMENVLDSVKHSFQTLNDAHVNAIKGMANMGALQESLRSTFRDIDINWEKSLSSIKNISAVVESTFKDLNFAEICNSYLVEGKCDITTEEEREMKDDVVDIINSTLDEKILENCEKKWHEKHPFLYEVIVGIIIYIITCMLDTYVINANTKKDSNIYVDSNNKSSIIISIPENTPITIIDNSINYYYKIIYTDSEENNDIEGYISKINVITDN